MSRFALLLITDAQSVDDACRGWLPPLETPIKKLIKNPFNGKTISVDSYVPCPIGQPQCLVSVVGYAPAADWSSPSRFQTSGRNCLSSSRGV